MRFLSAIVFSLSCSFANAGSVKNFVSGVHDLLNGGSAKSSISIKCPLPEATGFIEIKKATYSSTGNVGYYSFLNGSVKASLVFINPDFVSDDFESDSDEVKSYEFLFTTQKPNRETFFVKATALGKIMVGVKPTVEDEIAYFECVSDG